MKVGDWKLARAAVAGMGTRAQRAESKANAAEAHLFRALAVKAFDSRGASNGKTWPKLAKRTIEKKGTSKPLVEHGDLRNSIVVIIEGETAFVGVSSKKKSRDGKPMVNIAAVHEFGKVLVQLRNTARSRGKGFKRVIITIPARSFLQSTADFHFKPTDVKQRMLARVAVNMGAGWSVQAPPNARTLAKQGRAVAKAKK